MKRWIGFLFLVCILTFSKAHAQSLFKQPSYAVRFFYGSFLTRQPKAQYLRDSYSYFGEFSLVQQTDGRKAWQRANALPQVGLAAFYGNSGSKKQIGFMAGLFPFVAWRLFKNKWLHSGLRAGAGLGYIQKPYDKITNHKNVLIGTHGNAFINFLWQTEASIFSNLHINAGLSFSHFSNGSSTLPNLGLNIPALAVGLRYGLTKKVDLQNRTHDSVQTRNRIAFYTGIGLKQFPWIEATRYVVNTAQTEWSYRFSHSGMFSGGLILFYDRSLEVNRAGILDQKRTGSKAQAGLYVGYEHLFGRLSVPLQAGTYVYNRGTAPVLFQQVGFRYRITQRWRAQLAMKTHAGKADFVHAGVGYQFN